MGSNMDDTRDDGLEQDSRTVSTPEGDNEYPFDQPLTPSDVESDVGGLQRWPTNSAMEADKKHPAPEGGTEPHTGLRHVIDEVSTGKILPG